MKLLLPNAIPPLMRALARREQMASVLVFQIEATSVSTYRTGLVSPKPEHIDSWDPQPFLSEPNGIRLLEEIGRRAKALARESCESLDFLALTLPGTLDGASTIEGSSRLGILEPVNVTKECERLGAPPTYVFHDVECLAIGEILSSNLSPASPNPGRDTFAYILVDEGVGSSLFIDGRPYRGAGVAGHIGRLVVEPSGAFNPTFTSRGTLEVFCARPWVSQSVVNEYLGEKGKAGGSSATSSALRAAVEAAAERQDARKLTLGHLAEGIESRDPVVTAVLDEAARYLSTAINAIITIMNPPLIMLGGGMISSLPGFSHLVVSYARRNAWAGSWNETTIHITQPGRDPQIVGAAHLLAQTRAEAP